MTVLVNDAYQSEMYWVYRDNIPVYRSSNREDVFKESSVIKSHYPKSVVHIKKETKTEEIISRLM